MGIQIKILGSTARAGRPVFMRLVEGRLWPDSRYVRRGIGNAALVRAIYAFSRDEKAQ